MALEKVVNNIRRYYLQTEVIGQMSWSSGLNRTFVLLHCFLGCRLQQVLFSNNMDVCHQIPVEMCSYSPVSLGI